MKITKIDTYETIYSANTFYPRIELKSGGKTIGQLIFESNGSSLPLDTTSGEEVNLYYHRDDFGNVIDLLRHEKPMYLWFNGSGTGFENGIKSTPEPVGEREKPPAR
jgi:hypothetical protein